MKDRKEGGQSGVWNGILCRDYFKNKRIVNRVSLIISEGAILQKCRNKNYMYYFIQQTIIENLLLDTYHD